MKKVNLCISENDSISDFFNVSVSQIDSVPNGSIENINVAIINGLEYEEAKNILIQSLKKLKNEGLLTIEILDILTVAKDIFYGSATSKSVSAVLSNIKSVFYEQEIIDIVTNFPQFKIQNRYKDNNNIVMVVYKELKNAQ